MRRPKLRRTLRRNVFQYAFGILHTHEITVQKLRESKPDQTKQVEEQGSVLVNE